MKNRFVLVASCLTLLASGSCTSSNPEQADLSTSLDMSVAVDLTTPPDLTTLPPDLVPGCGFGQTLTGGTTCACDAKHATICNGNVYCCGTAQTCLPTAGPRGETRCSGPSAREAAILGYDPVRSNLILRTGECQDSMLNPILCQDQWVLGQTTWDIQTPTTAITARWGSNVAWLPTKQTLLLFGGQTTYNVAGSAVNDLYSWNGTDWTKLAPATGPKARAFTAMAYDPGRQVMVLFGGDDITDNELADTWEYSGNTGTWQQRVTMTQPPAREGHGLIYDANIQKSVLHAGLVAGVYGRDTWTYDGNDWSPVANNPAMAVHAYFGMAYDPVRKVTVLYGGETAGGLPIAETWEFNGSTWTQKTPLLNPGKRAKPAMAYDQVRQQMVLFGGNSGTNVLKDAWTWDGNTWSQIY